MDDHIELSLALHTQYPFFESLIPGELTEKETITPVNIFGRDKGIQTAKQITPESVVKTQVEKAQDGSRLRGVSKSNKSSKLR